MKKFFAIVLMTLLPGFAAAASITVSWVLPTTAVDGSPLTGGNALTSIQLFLSTSPIANNSTMTPTVTLTATATTTTQTFSANPGQTIYGRVKACNAHGCSDFSNEGSRLIPTSRPGVPTGVTITLNLE